LVAARRWGLGILSLAALLVYFLLEPAPPDEGSVNLSPTNYQSLINIAMSDYDANDALAESAPQQQVVNGWIARDLLQIQARAIADLLDALTQENAAGQAVASVDPRVPALLVIAVLAMSLIGVTAPMVATSSAEAMQAIPDASGTELVHITHLQGSPGEPPTSS
jgi:hypothetical protein